MVGWRCSPAATFALPQALPPTGALPTGALPTGSPPGPPRLPTTAFAAPHLPPSSCPALPRPQAAVARLASFAKANYDVSGGGKGEGGGGGQGGGGCAREWKRCTRVGTRWGQGGDKVGTTIEGDEGAERLRREGRWVGLPA